ncbi:MAG: hypothetical protein ACK4UJ_10960 [Leptonema sp. (in: bacteria)]
MNAKTLKFLIVNLWLFSLFFCKSSADQPTTDYNLVALFNPQILNGIYWDGISELSGCTVSSSDPTPCIIYQENYNNNFISNRKKNLYIYVDSLQATGKITLEISNPDTFSSLKVDLPVSASINIGPETGNGYSRILILSNPNPVTIDSIEITLNNFSADVLEDGLRGSFDLNVKSQTNASNHLSLKFSFNIKKIL